VEFLRAFMLPRMNHEAHSLILLRYEFATAHAAAS
jgi:hypothetical protein